MATAAVMESLARVTPATSARVRDRQIMDAVKASSEELANTPTICRKSYVHETVVTAFEDGLLERFLSRLKRSRSQAGREQVLLQVMTLAAGGKWARRGSNVASHTTAEVIASASYGNPIRADGEVALQICEQ